MMSPLKGKGHPLQRLKDKFSRSKDEKPNSQSRLSSSSADPNLQGHPKLGANLGQLTPPPTAKDFESFGTASTSLSTSASGAASSYQPHSPSHSSLMSLEYTNTLALGSDPRQGANGTPDDPIDLTGADKLAPLRASGQSFGDRFSGMDWELDDEALALQIQIAETSRLGPDEQKMLEEDEKLARTLQDQWSAEASGSMRTRNAAVGPRIASGLAVPASFARNFQIGPPSPTSAYLGSDGISDDDLRSLGQGYFFYRCKCNSNKDVRAFAKPADLIKRTRGCLEAGWYHPFIPCTKCKTSTCIGCRSQCKNPDSLGGLESRSTGDLKISWCCAKSRLLMAWALCCGLDEPATVDAPKAPPTTLKKSTRIGFTKTPDLKPPPGPATAFATGVGYGGPEGYSPVSPHNVFLHGAALVASTKMPKLGRGTAGASQTLPKARLNLEEKLLETVFRALALLLPSLEGDSQFDYQPSPLVCLMLQRSPVLVKLTELLRSNSISDISERDELYSGALDLLERLSNHPSTSAMVYSAQRQYPVSQQLLSFTTNASQASTTKPDSTTSLADLFSAVALQFRRFRQNYLASGMDLEEEEEDLSLTDRIIALAAHHEANRPSDQAAPEGPTPARQSSSRMTRAKQAEKAKADLAEWHKSNCLGEVLDDHILTSFAFQHEANALNNQLPSKGRMKRLNMDLTAFQASQAEGIYVRHGDSRLDIIKVLIVGPKDTPYENGLFEFDMFCGADFPNHPPQMRLKTTGGGLVRFNPNLYNDGTVCLSLLGTWQGQQWVPNQSTIMQILLSIQSMVFTAQPWYNEPGRENAPNQRESDRYNLQVQHDTIRHAILHWLDARLSRSPAAADPPAETAAKTTAVLPTAPLALPPVFPAAPAQDDCIWGDVIRKHFAVNGQDVVTRATKWAGTDKVKQGLVSDLKAAMTRHKF